MGEEENNSQPAVGVEEQKTADAQPTKKGNGAATVIIVVIVILAILGIGGYFASQYAGKKIGQKIGENIVENAIESQTGTKVDVSTNDDSVSIQDENGGISTGSKATWPTDMPSSVPRFSAGTISYTASNNAEEAKSWSLSFGGVYEADVASYTNDLVNAGWTEKDMIDAGLMKNWTYENGQYSLNLSFDPSSNGMLFSLGNKVQ